jgi:hypothetical protein
VIARVVALPSATELCGEVTENAAHVTFVAGEGTVAGASPTLNRGEMTEGQW